MEYLVGLLLLVAGVAFYYKKKFMDAKVDSILSETRGRDKELKNQQAKNRKKASELDSKIEAIKKERKERRDGKSRAERAKEWE